MRRIDGWIGARGRSCLIAALLLMTLPGLGHADDAGASAGEFLRFGTGAKAPAMGNAYTARADQTSALFYNPAGLGFTRDKQVSAAYQNLVLDVAQGDIAYAQPWGDRGAVGVSLRYVDYGSTARTTISTAGGALAIASNLGSFGGTDIAAGLSYGREMGSWSWGATTKFVSQEIDNVTATAVAADFGLQWRVRDRYAIGATVQNVGTSLTFDTIDEDLPMTGRAGISGAWFDSRLRANLDLEKVVDGKFSVMLGGEWWLAEMFALRAGYDGRTDADESAAGFTFGLGLRAGKFDFDYAYLPMGNLGNNHRVGMNYNF